VTWTSPSCKTPPRHAPSPVRDHRTPFRGQYDELKASTVELTLGELLLRLYDCEYLGVALTRGRRVLPLVMAAGAFDYYFSREALHVAVAVAEHRYARPYA
jgi:hypothetical protein